MFANLKALISRVLAGEIPLRRMFWLGLFLGSFLLVPLATGIIGMLLAVVMQALFDAYRPALAVAGGLATLYWVVALVGTWQSASNYQGTLGWGYLAKGVVIVMAIYITTQLPQRALMLAEFATGR